MYYGGEKFTLYSLTDNYEYLGKNVIIAVQDWWVRSMWITCVICGKIVRFLFGSAIFTIYLINQARK